MVGCRIAFAKSSLDFTHFFFIEFIKAIVDLSFMMDVNMDGRTGRRTGRGRDGERERGREGERERRRDGETDRRTDGQTDRQTDRQQTEI